MKLSTPWGMAQTHRELAPGITEVSTASHGGIKLSQAPLDSLLALLPATHSWAGLPWFEEDCDWAYVALAFPEVFDDHSLLCAVEMTERGLYLKLPAPFFLEPHGARIMARVTAFRATVADKWRTGSMSAGGNTKGWAVHFDRGIESKWIQFAEYPTQTYYTDAELAEAALV